MQSSLETLPSLPKERGVEAMSEEGVPSKLHLEICGSYGDFTLSISVVDDSGKGIPNAPIRILEQNGEKQVKNLRTAKNGARLHRIAFQNERKHITVQVPGSNIEPKSRVLYGPRRKKE